MQNEHYLDNKHTTAILTISNFLKELGGDIFSDLKGTSRKTRDRKTKSMFNGRVPDILVNINGSYLVVEIGSTEAEKILEYQQNDKVHEIRWYTKNCEIAGHWRRHNGVWVNSSENIIDITEKMKMIIVLEKEIHKLEEISKATTEEAETELARLNKLKLDRQASYSRKVQKVKFKEEDLKHKEDQLKKEEQRLIKEEQRLVKKEETLYARKAIFQRDDDRSRRLEEEKARVVRIVYSKPSGNDAA